MASDYEKEKARIKGYDDAKRGAGTWRSTFDPPKDGELRAHYEAGFEKGKEDRYK